MKKIIEKNFLESAKIIQESLELSEQIEKCVTMISTSLKNGKKICLFGNGGSAADAQHFAAELIGRYNMERESIPAISFTTDTSIITSMSNDYSFDDIFSRQCEGLVNEDDIVIAISTSGNSKNVINGAIMAKKKKAKIIGLLGNAGGKLKENVDIPIIVKSNITPRIQEVLRVIYHIICELVEIELMKNR